MSLVLGESPDWGGTGGWLRSLFAAAYGWLLGGQLLGRFTVERRHRDGANDDHTRRQKSRKNRFSWLLEAGIKELAGWRSLASHSK